ncbi:hypothetical protein MARPU_11140 [Marichromatium purpuratum 984]|uniref:Uncharacterized protein n=1 Tax=Marichromatium purpuratum 984 TaxID=765910 RepID=W0E476_MARPU|nr:hypothetical protein MARPU_11140 [Marichromatium purpuratum 984]
MVRALVSLRVCAGHVAADAHSIGFTCGFPARDGPRCYNEPPGQ